MTFHVVLTPDDGTLLVTCPALPEVTTFGTDEKDALAHALGAIEEALAARMADGREIPGGEGRAGSGPRSGRRDAPNVRLPALTALKVELYGALRRSGVTRAELARRLGWKRESVDRLFRLDHRSRLEQIEAAFAALGRTIEVEVREVA